MRAARIFTDLKCLLMRDCLLYYEPIADFEEYCAIVLKETLPN